MDNPTKGLYCPKTEDHQGRRGELLCCFGEDAIYLKCRKHDWLRIELYSAGGKLAFNNLSAVFTDVELPEDKQYHKFDLKPVPYVADGAFPVYKRSKRKEDDI